MPKDFRVAALFSKIVYLCNEPCGKTEFVLISELLGIAGGGGTSRVDGIVRGECSSRSKKIAEAA